MQFNPVSSLVWAFILDIVESGEVECMPVPVVGCPAVGDVICLESKETETVFSEPAWVYVQVDGVYDYYSQSRDCFVPDLKLVSFHRVSTLDDVVVS